MRLTLLTAFFATLLLATQAAAQVQPGTLTIPRNVKLLPPIASPHSTLLPALRMKVQAEPAAAPARTCAVPLLNVLPRDANPDPGMVIVRAMPISRMPVIVPPAPACDEASRPGLTRP